MASPLTLTALQSALTLNGLGQTDLTAKARGALLSNNAGVQKLNASLAQDRTRLSALGQLHSALAGFQAVAQSLGNGGLLTAGTASDPKVLTPVTVGGAKAGTYAVEVRQLARGQVLDSRTVADPNAAIGTGAPTTIKIEFGTQAGSSFAANGARPAVKLTIDSSNNTLKGIASAFKAAGVDARIVQSGNSFALRLNGQEGAQNSLRISVGGDAALQKLLSYNPAGSSGLSQTAAARSAQLSVDGKDLSSDSNVVTGAIGGTALALTAKGATQVTVAQSPAQIGSNVEQFVASYNQLNAAITALQQGDLKADGKVTQVARQLGQVLGNSAGLNAAGIRVSASGALQVDKKALAAAIAADPGAVGKLFINDGKGVAEKLGAKIGEILGNNGVLKQQTQAIEREVGALNQQKAELTRALGAQNSALLAQYGQGAQGNNALPGLPGSTRPGGTLFDLLA